MNVNVKLFAAARQLAGCDSLHLTCPEPCTLVELRQAMIRECPQLEPLMPHVRIAVNSEYASNDQRIRASDELACIPPVSGG